MAENEKMSLPTLPDASVASGTDGCWSREGVYGNHTCPELVKSVHCRNCPVLVEAGARQLDRPLSDEYRRELSSRFVQPWKQAASDRTSVLIFRLAREWFALPVHAFQEVAERRPIHSLPGRDQGIVLGVASFRGEIIACFSLGHLLGVEGLPPRDVLRGTYPRMLIVAWEGKRLCFPVDEVQGIHRVARDELGPVPPNQLKAGSYARGLIRWRQHSAGLLEPRRLFEILNRGLS